MLDTHVFVWTVGESGKLSRQAVRCVNDLQNEVWLSPISVLEMANLHQKGKLEINRGFEEWLTEAFTKLSCQQAPFTFDVALETRAISSTHHDPADRIIAATARLFDLTLVTADEALLAEPTLNTMRA